MHEIVLGYKAVGNHDEEAEFRDLVRPLMAVLQSGSYRAQQAAADAIACLAQDHVSPVGPEAPSLRLISTIV
eukprot:scaffold615434_cov41-Prasinocladus_malaysianus.AAC.1